MTQIKVRSHTFSIPTVRDSYYRRALKYQENIFASLKKIGLSKDYVDVEVPMTAMKAGEASVTWWIDGHQLHYSFNRCSKFVENIAVVAKVIELEVTALLEGEKEISTFIHDFSEDDKVAEKRKDARELFGVDPKETDWEVIQKSYKKLSKKHHPDMPTGNIDEFKKLNDAHKLLKRELQ